jgi:hypothetical protein
MVAIGITAQATTDTAAGTDIRLEDITRVAGADPRSCSVLRRIWPGIRLRVRLLVDSHLLKASRGRTHEKVSRRVSGDKSEEDCRHDN